MASDNFKLIELYKGKVKVKFFPDSHVYMVNGTRKGSVTGALNIIDKSQPLIIWAVGLFVDFLYGFCGKTLTEQMIDEGAEQHTIKKTEASNIGTKTHEWIDQYVKGEKPAMPKDKNVLKAVTGFLNWVESNKIKFIDAEKIIYSMKHDFVGQMDAIATMNGTKKKYLIDYKVSNGLYPGVAYQTAAYLKADEEESGTKYAGRWAIRLSKESEEEYYERQEKKLTKWLRKNEGKQPYSIPAYVPFEAMFLDEKPEHIEDDWQGFQLASGLTAVHRRVEKRFFSFGK